MHVITNTINDGKRLPCWHIGAIENTNNRDEITYDEIDNPKFL
jgi:hypothetical protein